MKRAHRNKGPTVLLVDDEPLVRWLGADVLEDAGFEVIEATNADEALGMLQDRPDVRVLFTDADMPGSLNGFELASLVHRRWPAIQVVITSAHMRPHPDDIPDQGRFVPKPYQAKAVVNTIREMTRHKH